MVLRVKDGVTLSPGDLVALNENGELIKAGKVYDPVGVVMMDARLGHPVVRTITKDGYTGEAIEVQNLVTASWNPRKDSDPIADIKRAVMGSSNAPKERSTLIEEMMRFVRTDPHLPAIVQDRLDRRQAEQEAQAAMIQTQDQILGTAMNSALAGQLAEIHLGGLKLPTFEIRMPDPPPLPMPEIPSLPTYKTPMDDNSQSVKIVFDKDGKRPFWVGLLLQDGREVQAPEYDRQMVEIDMRGSSVSTKFPTSARDWGVVTHIALYDSPDASAPMLTFPTNVATNVTAGSVLNLADVRINPMPVGLAPEKRLHLGPPKVAEDEREPLKQKMEEARERLKGILGS